MDKNTTIKVPDAFVPLLEDIRILTAIKTTPTAPR